VIVQVSAAEDVFVLLDDEIADWHPVRAVELCHLAATLLGEMLDVCAARQ
jgi:hypothetical protein